MAMYSAGVAVASLRSDKARKFREGHRHVLDRLRKMIEPDKAYLWVHAASLGEFEQGRPLMERYRRLFPEKRIILTFFSPSGYEVRKNYAGADIICYLPFDFPWSARRFVETVRPEMAIFVKYEFWRNYLNQLRAHGVPTYLVSGIFRPEQKFFRKSGSWYRAWLRNFTHIFVQDEGSRRLLESVGFDNVTVAGDTRFDRVADIRDARKAIPELEAFRQDSPFVFMAGSSWPQDEQVYAPWVLNHKDVKCVIAPHEFDGRRIQDLKDMFRGEAVALSEVKEKGAVPTGKRVMIIDCFGLLSSAYAYADMAYVGGAFGAGLHNINEAAVYGIPVIFGPKYDKFLEAKELTTLGGAVSIDGEAGFRQIADRMLYDSKERATRGKWAGEYIREKIGASDKIATRIFRIRN
ncbi:MAG: 3-deoxy-D-manno-octulosonic acid transferase [Muribaculum sp.]|nr:3-deoxy-D-manno-octulosonic acid transferase [Muribaculum sp.]